MSSILLNRKPSLGGTDNRRVNTNKLVQRFQIQLYPFSTSREPKHARSASSPRAHHVHGASAGAPNTMVTKTQQKSSDYARKLSPLFDTAQTGGHSKGRNAPSAAHHRRRKEKKVLHQSSSAYEKTNTIESRYD